MNPNDWASMELLEAADSGLLKLGASNAGGAGVPISAPRRQLWGVTVAPVPSIPAGTAVLGDWSGSTKLFIRQDLTIEWSDAVQGSLPGSGRATASRLQRNAIAFRAEMRAVLAVPGPPGS